MKKKTLFNSLENCSKEKIKKKKEKEIHQLFPVSNMHPNLLLELIMLIFVIDFIRTISSNSNHVLNNNLLGEKNRLIS